MWEEAEKARKASDEAREKGQREQASKEEKLEARVGDMDRREKEQEKKWDEAEKARKAADEAREKGQRDQASKEEKLEATVGELERWKSEEETKAEAQEKSRQDEAIARSEKENKRMTAKEAEWKAAQDAAAKKVHPSESHSLCPLPLTIRCTVSISHGSSVSFLVLCNGFPS